MLTVVESVTTTTTNLAIHVAAILWWMAGLRLAFFGPSPKDEKTEDFRISDLEVRQAIEFPVSYFLIT